MFGFLLTTFPRWLGRPDLPKTRSCRWPAACSAHVLANVGLLDLPWLLKLGIAVMLVGYLVGVWTLGGVLRASVAERGSARSCLMALSLAASGWRCSWPPYSVRRQIARCWRYRLVLAACCCRSILGDPPHAAVLHRQKW